MASSRTTTLVRISELLDVIDTSSSLLRDFLRQEEGENERGPGDISSGLGIFVHGGPSISKQASILRIACERLAEAVTPPRHLIFEAAGSFYKTTALEIVVKFDIATLIDKITRETQQEGVHTEVLSKQSSLESDLLARILRHLSVYGIFQEIAPYVFSNTIASSTLVNNPEFRAHLDLLMHEGQIAAPFFQELMERRFLSSTKSPGEQIPQLQSAFSIFSNGEPFYQWLHSPKNMERGKNFNLAMRGMSTTEGLGFLAIDYPFNAIPADTAVVDVGGGVGSLADLLLPSVPDLRLIIQDLESVIAQANEIASPAMKRYIADGRVKFQVQDCFAPQPADVAGGVFILKTMLHNYPDSEAVRILQAIRLSNPLKILIIDRLLVPHLRTQASTEDAEIDIYRSFRNDLRSLSEGDTSADIKLSVTSQGIPTTYDLVMGSLHGGRTRTLDQWQELLACGGYKLSRVYPLRGSTGQAVLEANTI